MSNKPGEGRPAAAQRSRTCSSWYIPVFLAHGVLRGCRGSGHVIALKYANTNCELLEEKAGKQ